MGFDGSPSAGRSARRDRAEIRLYTAAVLRHVPEEPLQPVPMGTVFLADEIDVAIALRMDGYLKPGARTGIPIGVYRAGGTDAPIYLDADFLIGPEAAHLNISGVSGLATKTSAVEWLLQSIFTHFPAQKGSVAAVCFNVKGPDLCFLDQPGEIDERRPRALRASAASRPSRSSDVAVLRPVQVRRRLAQHAPLERGAARQRHARSRGGCARCCSTPRCCSTRTTSTRRPTR